MDKQNELTALTRQLLKRINKMTEMYSMVRETGKSGDFYEEVKPFADEVKLINDKWKNEAIKWVIATRPKNLYPQQIESTHEHLETISVQAFFPETSRSRFKNLVASSNYVLNQMLQLLLIEEMGSPPS
ncbi:YppE family protein [Bacillus sp. FJAT-49705]|uniref:YppE family protein n=1 Tax=Cytobacillus citreus TaxID=2833586 RepID=A0ABS5NT31_9BACI|nr:YppE family protein [Cytobacillus citreus]MBS4190995.1 YppE family protein [Cytobacillus citreus]